MGMGKIFGETKKESPKNEIEKDKDLIIKAYKNAGCTTREIKILSEVYGVRPYTIASYLHDWNHREPAVQETLKMK